MYVGEIWLSHIFDDITRYSMISRHIILRFILIYHGIFHDITRYSVISWYKPWYHDIFYDITAYSMISRHTAWYHDILLEITIYSMISRYIPWYHDVFLMNLWNTSQYLITFPFFLSFPFVSIDPLYFRNTTSSGFFKTIFGCLSLGAMPSHEMLVDI